jgi:RHS repeat-associated protein
MNDKTAVWLMIGWMFFINLPLILTSYIRFLIASGIIRKKEIFFHVVNPFSKIIKIPKDFHVSKKSKILIRLSIVSMSAWCIVMYVCINSSTFCLVSEQITYDEFGNILTNTSPGFQPFGFAGCLYDTDTKLCHFGARDYDGSIGRWLNKDPILFNGGDTNLYGYVLQDPIKRVDYPHEFPLLANFPAFHRSHQRPSFSHRLSPHDWLRLELFQRAFVTFSFGDFALPCFSAP